MSIDWDYEDTVPDWDDQQDDPWDDDLYWVNQREADDYRYEPAILLPDEVDDDWFDEEL